MHKIVKILKAPTAGEAKRLGQKVKLRKDWEEVKRKYMYRFLRRKFRHKELRRKLRATGDAKLIEGNNWDDTYWGVCDGVGKNHLGKLLMKLRDKINAKKRKSKEAKSEACFKEGVLFS